MKKPTEINELIAHLFRHESGKMIAVLTGIFGSDNLILAEDIVQDTLEEAISDWTYKGIPENPTAWLYKVAKNKTLTALKRNNYQKEYVLKTRHAAQLYDSIATISFSEKNIADDQLRMMFLCCHPSISENSQIALILKILCGFSISEIADSFFTSNETINKRLVRGRKQLKENKVSFEVPANIDENLSIVLKTIYLLFNEGYFPSRKNQVVRYDLCLEAIRLLEFLLLNCDTKIKGNTLALLALMYFNASRFEARIDADNSTIDLEKQDRRKWNKKMIQKGSQYLEEATKANVLSNYLILATISAHHCIAPSFDTTNWEEIIVLYDQLIQLEDSPIIRLNRCVALSKARGNKLAIEELQQLEHTSDIGNHFLFYSTLGEFYRKENQTELAISQFKQAISLAQNTRDIEVIEKKIEGLVPIS